MLGAEQSGESRQTDGKTSPRATKGFCIQPLLTLVLPLCSSSKALEMTLPGSFLFWVTLHKQMGYGPTL